MPNIQEDSLQAIADAIRAKDGTTASIPASQFAQRILDINAIPDGLRTITLESNDKSLGTVSGGGFASDGMRITAKALSANGKIFMNWKEGDNVVCMTPFYPFDVAGDRTLKATFADYTAVPTMHFLPSEKIWTTTAYGNNRFVALAYGACAYSTDGVTWVAGNTPPYSQYWNRIAYGAGKFVAVGSPQTVSGKSDTFMYTTDGITWTKVTVPVLAQWCSIVYGAGKFVAISNDCKCVYSTDGTSWTETILPSMYGTWEIAYGANKFIIVNTYGYIAYSTDGVIWNYLGSGDIDTSQSYRCGRLVWGGDKFISIWEDRNSNTYQDISYSPDGLNWTKVAGVLPVKTHWNDIAYGNGIYILTPGKYGTSDTTNYFAYSTDGLNWIKVTLQQNVIWCGVTFGDNKFVMVSGYHRKQEVYSSGASKYAAMIPAV